MMNLSSECRAARRDMLRRDDLAATNRGRLDVHIKRCEHCHIIYESLKEIEAYSQEIPEIDRDSQREIYNGLIPIVNEITNEINDTSKRKFRPWDLLRQNPAWGLSGVVAAALLVVMMVTLVGNDRDLGSEDVLSYESQIANRDITMSSVVDRHEGTIVIDGKEVARKERFNVRRGTYIEVDESSRFSFHIGDLARVAMFGDTKWELSAVSDSFIAINLDQGRMAVEFDGSLGKTMEITTPDSIVRVKGTIFTVEVLKDNTTEVGVIEGIVEVVARRGNNEIIHVAQGELGIVPGDGEVIALTDRHRSLAAEMSIDLYPEELTKLVSFDGSPERVKVEVDGRVLGTTPLAVRLPDAPFAYKLTSPGMDPVSGSVVDHRHSGQVDFSLVPQEEFEPIPGEVIEVQSKRSNSKRSGVLRKRRQKRDWNLFKRARSAMRAGDLPFAIGLLEKAIVDVEKESRAPALSLLAESYAAAGMYDKATNTYDRLSDVSTDSTVVQNARYEVGRLSMDQLGDLSRARAAFTAYVASPNGGGLREEAYYSLCELNGREGAHRDSLHCFNQFLRSFVGGNYEPDARLWRGALYQDVKKDWKQAEADLLYFIESKPHHPRSDEARYRVVIGRYQLGDKRGVLRMIDEYMEKHPRGQYKVRVERIRTAVLDSNFSLKHQSK